MRCNEELAAVPANIINKCFPDIKRFELRQCEQENKNELALISGVETLRGEIIKFPESLWICQATGSEHFEERWQTLQSHLQLVSKRFIASCIYDFFLHYAPEIPSHFVVLEGKGKKLRKRGKLQQALGERRYRPQTPKPDIGNPVEQMPLFPLEWIEKWPSLPPFIAIMTVISYYVESPAQSHEPQEARDRLRNISSQLNSTLSVLTSRIRQTTSKWLRRQLSEVFSFIQQANQAITHITSALATNYTSEVTPPNVTFAWKKMIRFVWSEISSECREAPDIFDTWQRVLTSESITTTAGMKCWRITERDNDLSDSAVPDQEILNTRASDHAHLGVHTAGSCFDYMFDRISSKDHPVHCVVNDRMFYSFMSVLNFQKLGVCTGNYSSTLEVAALMLGRSIFEHSLTAAADKTSLVRLLKGGATCGGILHLQNLEECSDSIIEEIGVELQSIQRVFMKHQKWLPLESSVYQVPSSSAILFSSSIRDGSVKTKYLEGLCRPLHLTYCDSQAFLQLCLSSLGSLKSVQLSHKVSEVLDIFECSCLTESLYRRDSVIARVWKSILTMDAVLFPQDDPQIFNCFVKLLFLEIFRNTRNSQAISRGRQCLSEAVDSQKVSMDTNSDFMERIQLVLVTIKSLGLKIELPLVVSVMQMLDFVWNYDVVFIAGCHYSGKTSLCAILQHTIGALYHLHPSKYIPVFVTSEMTELSSWETANDRVQKQTWIMHDYPSVADLQTTVANSSGQNLHIAEMPSMAGIDPSLASHVGIVPLQDGKQVTWQAILESRIAASPSTFVKLRKNSIISFLKCILNGLFEYMDMLDVFFGLPPKTVLVSNVLKLFYVGLDLMMNSFGSEAATKYSYRNGSATLLDQRADHKTLESIVNVYQTSEHGIFSPIDSLGTGEGHEGDKILDSLPGTLIVELVHTSCIFSIVWGVGSVLHTQDQQNQFEHWIRARYNGFELQSRDEGGSKSFVEENEEKRIAADWEQLLSFAPENLPTEAESSWLFKAVQKECLPVREPFWRIHAPLIPRKTSIYAFIPSFCMDDTDKKMTGLFSGLKRPSLRSIIESPWAENLQIEWVVPKETDAWVSGLQCPLLQTNSVIVATNTMMQLVRICEKLILNGNHVLLSAPKESGKTTVLSVLRTMLTSGENLAAVSGLAEIEDFVAANSCLNCGNFEKLSPQHLNHHVNTLRRLETSVGSDKERRSLIIFLEDLNSEWNVFSEEGKSNLLRNFAGLNGYPLALRRSCYAANECDIHWKDVKMCFTSNTEQVNEFIGLPGEVTTISRQAMDSEELEEIFQSKVLSMEVPTSTEDSIKIAKFLQKLYSLLVLSNAQTIEPFWKLEDLMKLCNEINKIEFLGNTRNQVEYGVHDRTLFSKFVIHESVRSLGDRMLASDEKESLLLQSVFSGFREAFGVNLSEIFAPQELYDGEKPTFSNLELQRKVRSLTFHFSPTNEDDGTFQYKQFHPDDENDERGVLLTDGISLSRRDSGTVLRKLLYAMTCDCNPCVAYHIDTTMLEAFVSVASREIGKEPVIMPACRRQHKHQEFLEDDILIPVVQAWKAAVTRAVEENTKIPLVINLQKLCQTCSEQTLLMMQVFSHNNCFGYPTPQIISTLLHKTRSNLRRTFSKITDIAEKHEKAKNISSTYLDHVYRYAETGAYKKRVPKRQSITGKIQQPIPEASVDLRCELLCQYIQDHCHVFIVTGNPQLKQREPFRTAALQNWQEIFDKSHLVSVDFDDESNMKILMQNHFDSKQLEGTLLPARETTIDYFLSLSSLMEQMTEDDRRPSLRECLDAITVTGRIMQNLKNSDLYCTFIKVGEIFRDCIKSKFADT